MKVLLISTNTEEAPYPVYPLGMSTIAGAIVQQGHIVRQADILYGQSVTTIADYIQQQIHDFHPEVIGLSIRNIDNVDYFTSEHHWQISSIKALIDIIRATSQAPIVLGGAGFSIMPEEIIEYTKADFGIVGEGELAFCTLLSQLAQNVPVPKLSKHTTRCFMSEMASPLYDSTLLDFYAHKSGVLNVQTKRGCPNHCLYCTYPLLEGGTIRPRSPEEVLDDISRLMHKHTQCEVFFTDAVFNDTHGHWLTLVEAMAKASICIPWTAFFEPRGLHKSEIKLCMQTGLKAIEFGTDAASDITLAAMKKKFTFEQVLESTAICQELGLPNAHFVIFGGPKETENTLIEGLNNLDRLNNSLVFAFLGIRIYPQSPLMQYAINEGTIQPDSHCLHPTYYFSPSISEGKASDIITARFKKNRLRIFPPEKGQEKVCALRQLGYRGILWDNLTPFPQQVRTTSDWSPNVAGA